MLPSSHDVRRRYFDVDKPSCLLDGVHKGKLFAPSRVRNLFGTANLTSTSLNSSKFSDPIPLGDLVSFVRRLKGIHLIFNSVPIKPFGATKIGQSHPRAFSDAPRATRVSHFLRVASRLGNRALEANASLLYCRTGNASVRPPSYLSFSTGTDLCSVDGRPLCRFSAYFGKVYADVPMDNKPVWLVCKVCFTGFERPSSKPKDFGLPAV